MRPLTATVSHESDTPHSYLVELRKLAIPLKTLTHPIFLRLKNAQILVGSRHVQNQGSNQATDHVGGDKEDQDLEYKLLSSNQVAIVDDTIGLQQFGEDIFCAPQEDALEGEHSCIHTPQSHTNFRNCRCLPDPWLQTAQ